MKVNYPQTILRKSDGSTGTEAYLGRLCNETFLSLWSYPNVFRDQGRTDARRSRPKGDGKELCDLLVVFDEHIIIFSDKRCEFPDTGDIQLDWSRWYRRAVKKSAHQIWGAERWILSYPRTIYIDKECIQPFPYAIPPKSTAKVHRIVVCHGIADQCREYFGGGSGSFFLSPIVIGDMHMRSHNRQHPCSPFVIGQVDPSKGYVHVFDDTSLEVVMKTLDTVSDFTRYLTKKEELLENGKLLAAAGEDDLLAHYLMHIDEDGQHTFFPGESEQADAIVVDEGFWKWFARHPSRVKQLEANEISYSWDALIEKFLSHLAAGISRHMSHPHIPDQEKLFRILASENRTRRRLLATTIHDLIDRVPEGSRATRIVLPSQPGDACYVFLLLARRGKSEEDYRQVRVQLLEDYVRIAKHKYPEVKDLIGIATETGWSEERTEDIVYLGSTQWTSQDEEQARELTMHYQNLGLLANPDMFTGVVREFPDETPVRIRRVKGRHRNKPCPCGSGKKFKHCCGK